MKIKSDEELFYEIYTYASRLTALAAIVQNDCELTTEEYKEWAQCGVKNINDIKDWMKRIYLHIQRCQNEK